MTPLALREGNMCELPTITTGKYGSLQVRSLKRFGLANESRAITSEFRDLHNYLEGLS